MSIDFQLPAVGENIDKADIGALRIAVGDVISPGQIVMDIETEKAVFELPCPHGGKVMRIHVKPGDSVPVGAKLLTIEESAPAKTHAKAPESKPSAGAPPAAPPPEKPSPALAPEPARRTESPVGVTAQSTAPAVAPARAAPPGDGEQVPPAPAGPATRRLARELGVDLHRVKGSGSGGRITSEDVQAYVKAVMTGTGPAPVAGGPVVAPPLPDFSQFGPIERQPLGKVMRTAAANLSVAWNVIPHVTQHELADVTDLEAARKRYAQGSAARDGGPKITMTVLALKAVISALKAFPRFNASFDAATGELILKKYFHIGVAVDTEMGLMVPVIRNVDSKSVVQLATELGELAQKARDRKLALTDMQGGSFTISNLGGIGGTYFTPIVNFPEVAILGLSRTAPQQVVLGGQAQIRLMMPLSLSYDHRVINGADAARFIVKLAGMLSDPFQLLSEV